jgi:hyperosmotically inducible protein
MRILVIAAAWLIIGLSAALPAWAGSEGSQEKSDLWLEAKLVTTYTLNEHLNPFKLKVDVKDGVAYLGGTVDSAVERDLAVEIAKGVEGIKEVRDNIRIEPEGAAEREESKMFRMVEDATITAKVKSKLLWNRHTKGLDIDVSTETGVVTLKGKVGSDVRRQLAIQLARNTNGVRRVVDRLQIASAGESKKQGAVKEVETKVNDAWITAKVKSMLAFSKSADGADIHVSTENGIVTLRGTVTDETQEEEVVRMAGDVVGVKRVNSRLAVEK